MSERPFVDISIPLRDGLLVWPGDETPVLERARAMARGDEADVTALRMTVHTGTHMDAPGHYVPGGDGIDRMPFDVSMGPARVIGIDDPEWVRAEALEGYGIVTGERVLFRTRNSEGRWWEGPFREDFVALSQEAAEWLVRRGIRMVGVDHLSVGPPGPEGAEVHRTLLEGGVWILEGLDLTSVKPGRYELACLPLRIEGADGAPARAVLRATPGLRSRVSSGEGSPARQPKCW